MARAQIKDPAWIVIGILFFIFAPLGIIGAIIKIIYMVVKNASKYEDEQMTKAFKRQTTPMNHTRATSQNSTTTYTRPVSQNSTVTYTRPEPLEVKPIKIKSPVDDIVIDTTIEIPMMDEIEMPSLDIKVLTPKDIEAQKDHTSDQPLKVITCAMCGTENNIYKIDIFETPSCEKCGMLLLDRT